jgi:hypothetical protein
MEQKKIHKIVLSINFEKRGLKDIDKEMLINKLISDENYINQHFKGANNNVSTLSSLTKYFDFIELAEVHYFGGCSR